jgi:hypothetical protein
LFPALSKTCIWWPCEFRHTYADLLLHGTFVDSEGFLCNNPELSVHGYRAGDRLAVTFWNPTDRAQAFEVLAPGYRLEKAEWQDPACEGGDHMIRAGGVAILIFRRN